MKNEVSRPLKAVRADAVEVTELPGHDRASRRGDRSELPGPSSRSDGNMCEIRPFHPAQVDGPNPKLREAVSALRKKQLASFLLIYYRIGTPPRATAQGGFLLPLLES